MKEDQLLEKLIELARSLNYDVRSDRGSFNDGSCRVEDRRIIVLNRTSSVLKKVRVLARALSELSLEGVFLLPAVREAIQEARAEDQKLESEEQLE